MEKDQFKMFSQFVCFDIFVYVFFFQRMAINFWTFSLQDVVLARRKISYPTSGYIYKRFRNLQDYLGNQSVVNGKNQRIQRNRATGYSSPSRATRAGTLCCKQILSAIQLKRNLENINCNTYYKLNCKSNYILSLK